MSRKNEGGWWLNNLDDLIFALGICMIAITIGNFLRRVISQRGVRIRESFKRVLYEAIGTAEQSVVSFELCYIVYENYSMYTFLIGVFMFSIWATSGPPTFQTISNPTDVISMYLTKDIRFEMAVIVILAQLVGAFTPYFLIIKPAWKYASWWCIWKDDNVHTTKIMEPTWTTAVDPSSPVISAISEGFITCLMYLTTRFIHVGFQPLNGEGVANTQRIITIFFNTILGGIGTPYSGGFYNPAIASALECLTTGVDIGTKVWVYWISPIFGMVLALFLESYIIPNPQ